MTASHVDLKLFHEQIGKFFSPSIFELHFGSNGTSNKCSDMYIKTNTHIIEISHFLDWAIGVDKLLQHRLAYPDYESMLIIYGKCNDKDKLAKIKKECRSNKVTLSKRTT